MRRRIAHTLRVLARKIDIPAEPPSLEKHRRFIDAVEYAIHHPTR